MRNGRSSDGAQRPRAGSLAEQGPERPGGLARIRLGCGSSPSAHQGPCGGPPTPDSRPPRAASGSRSRKRRGPPSPQGALSPPSAFLGRRGPELQGPLPPQSSGLGGGPDRTWPSEGTGPAGTGPGQRPPERGQSASRPRLKVRPPCRSRGPPPCRSCTASGGSSSSTSRWWMRFWAPWGSRTPNGRSPWTGNPLPSCGRVGTAATRRCFLLLALHVGWGGWGVAASPPYLIQRLRRRPELRGFERELLRAGSHPAPCRVESAAGQRRQHLRVRCQQGRRLSTPPCAPTGACHRELQLTVWDVLGGLSFYPRAVRK